MPKIQASDCFQLLIKLSYFVNYQSSYRTCNVYSTREPFWDAPEPRRACDASAASGTQANVSPQEAESGGGRAG